MAIPRVFISSTYYDLKQVREDLGDFVHSLGYEVIRNEKSKIPYIQEGSLVKDCYREVSSCDIFVCIIGSAFGSKSDSDELSITMKELEQAITDRKKMYVFVDRDVYCESRTFRANRDNDLKPAFAKDIKILEYIVKLEDRVGRLQPILKFERAEDIISQLRDQLAGLFQNLLQREQTQSERNNAYSLHAEIADLKLIIDEIKDDHFAFCTRFESTVLVRHPLVKLIEQKLGAERCQFVIRDQASLAELMGLFGYEQRESEEWFDYCRLDGAVEEHLRIAKKAFGQDGALRLGNNKQERESWIQHERNAIEDSDGYPF